LRKNNISTKNFKIYNPDSKTIELEEIELMGGKNSPFRINVDGTAGTIFSNADAIGGGFNKLKNWATS
jgi:hypothetical protein